MVRAERRRALSEALTDLERYAATWSLEAFLASRDAQRMVLQALYVAVQAAVDEAIELLQERGAEPVASYRDAFLGLGRSGRLAPELARRLADWASFRNVLAHFYPVLDLRRVHAALSEIGDLRQFLDRLVEFDQERRRGG
jgi:uncharacterized protein YutE (UPF0331/DUF86 family)